MTVTQVGYAAGVFLVVPLGDTLNRRRLIPAILICSAVALGASALAPSFTVLLATLAVVGLTTVTGQLLIPLAGDLAQEDQRGRRRRDSRLGSAPRASWFADISELGRHALGWREHPTLSLLS